jgi:hypothetical protein
LNTFCGSTFGQAAQEDLFVEDETTARFLDLYASVIGRMKPYAIDRLRDPLGPEVDQPGNSPRPDAFSANDALGDSGRSLDKGNPPATPGRPYCSPDTGASGPDYHHVKITQARLLLSSLPGIP